MAHSKLLIKFISNGQEIDQKSPEEIRKGGLLIGRSKKCDWQIPESNNKASDQHAKLTYSFSLKDMGFHLFLTDMGSTNGIIYNDKVIRNKKIALKLNDSCYFGDVDTRLVVVQCKKNISPKQKQLNGKEAPPIYPKLKQLNGKEKGHEYILDQEETIIGSFRENKSKRKNKDEKDNKSVNWTDKFKENVKFTNGESIGELKDENNPNDSGKKVKLIKCEDESVSSEHATIKLITQNEENQYWIYNHGKNGTFVNDENLSYENANAEHGEATRMLTSGDEIRMGTVRFKFCPDEKSMLKQAIAVLCTLVIGIILLLLARICSPTAQYYLGRASQLADNEQYPEALSMIDKAKGARKSSIYIQEISDKQRQIQTWQETSQIWKSVKDTLLEKKFTASKNALGPIMCEGYELLWGGRTEHALTERNNAKLIDKVLGEILQAEIKMNEGMIVTEDNIADHDFRKRCTELEKSKEELEKSEKKLNELDEESYEDSLKILAFLKTKANQIVQELTVMEDQHNELANIFYDLKRTGELNQAEISCLALSEKVRTHVQERSKKGLPVYRGVLSALETFLAPLNQLRKAEDVYYHNLKSVNDFDFRQVNENLPLPSQQQSSVSPLFTKLRTELENRNTHLLNRALQIQTSVRIIVQDGNDTGNRSLAFTDMLDNRLWESVLECDFLNAAEGCKWSRERKEPVGDYDRLLGIEIFWNFMTSLSPEHVAPFDKGLLFDCGFTPSLYMAKEQYDHLEQFRDMMTSPFFEDLLTYAATNKTKLADLTQWANQLLLERDAKLVKEKMELSRKEKDERKSLILGGVALVLADARQMTVYKEDYRRLHDQLQTMRKRLEQMLETEASIDERNKLLETVLNEGLPGDSSIMKALQELGRWK